MTNRSYSYTRLVNSDEILSGRDQKVAPSEDPLIGTKLRRFQAGQRKERWPGSASHLPAQGSADYIEHVIKPKETLQGIALTYRCSVFDLKVANNIQRETEFFARRTVRIPVKQHSSLSEQVTSAQEETNTNSIDLKPAASNTDLVPTPSANSSEFLKQKDQDLQRLKEKARVYKIELNEALLEGESPLALNPVSARRTSRIPLADCRGDDCGLSWTHILGMALLVLLACPLLYFLYLELNLHRNLSLHSNMTTNISPSNTLTTNAL